MANTKRRESQKQRRESRERTRQRSFRLPDLTLRLLDRRAAERNESANRLARRLLDEALRTDSHPLIRFRQGPEGDRRPALAGRRLFVFQVVESVRASNRSAEKAAAYLEIDPRLVQACLDYYADFKPEVDAEIAADREFAEHEQERERRRREVLA